MIDVTDPAALRAEAERRIRLRAQGATTFAEPAAPDPEQDARDARREKEIEHEGDVMMQKLGFEVVRFSHPGKTRQTPGIPDRRYYRRPRFEERSDGRFLAKPLVVWVEYKSATGAQRPGQKLFQEMAEACGEAIVVGGIEELTDWLKRNL